MDNNFDYLQYHQYVHEMLAIMDDLGNPEILTVLYNKTIPVLNLLNVAFLSYEYAEQARATGLQINEFALPPTMELGPSNRDEVVDITPKVSEMVSIRLYAHPFVDRPVWDDERRELIKGFLALYFNLIARVRVLRMFESRIFQDQALPFAGNLSALMRDLGRLRGQNRLLGHTIYRMNMYHFSRYNRIFGRKMGDQILREYIQKLNSFSGEFGGVYRLGGDNFFGIIPNEMTPAVQSFFEEYIISTDDTSSEMILQSRAGFYRIESNVETNDNIVGRTNTTFAKTTAKNKICFFDIHEEKLAVERSRIESDFIKALKNGEIVPYYQPKVDPQDNRIVGVEALCRWIKNGSVIMPFKFISILESNNQICALDFYMLRKVCEDLIAWINRGREPVRVSINFSRNNLADKNFVSKIIGVIDEYKVPRDKITVELTETTQEVDFDELKNVIDNLVQAGVTVAVDDFGMGYSSLNLIKDANWDVLKIDKAFIPEVGSDNYDKSLKMLYNVIRMANDVGMTSVVEGVETESQKDIVKEFGCSMIQGYYYDKPLPKKELEEKMLGTFDGECLWHA